MRILRRADQELADRYPGVPRYGLAGRPLGSTKLHVGDLIYEVGAAVPHHNHPDAEETQIMLEGELECWLDGHRFIVGAGDCVVAKRGVGHAFFNRSNVAARMITAFSVTIPTTDHIPDPELDDDKPGSGVKFGLWPAEVAAGSETKRYPVNKPVGANETQCELLVLSGGDAVSIPSAEGQEAGVFLISGELEVGDDGAVLQAGDFVCAESESIGIRNAGNGAATLLTVRSLI